MLIDGLGALVSAVSLGIVLPRCETGLPDAVLFALSLCAVGLGTYSLTCGAFGRRRGRWLRGIAVANGLYCVATCWVVAEFLPVLTLYAVCYFVLELILVSLLATAEWTIASSS